MEPVNVLEFDVTAFGSAVRLERQRRNWPQHWLADEVGTTQTTLSCLERGVPNHSGPGRKRYKPTRTSACLALRLSLVLGLDPFDYLVEEERHAAAS